MSKPIYILCLHNVRTGGPEAIHQLSDALIEQGFDARMVYYDWAQIAALEAAEPNAEGYRFSGGPALPFAHASTWKQTCRTNEIEEYARYKVNAVEEIPNSPDAIVVLPETLCHLAPKFDKATVLIWWLSVDNGFGALSRVNLNHLRARNVDHAAQSRYAARFIEALGLPFAGMLSDYTVDLCEYAKPMLVRDRPKLVAINTNHKVIADWPGIVCEIAKRDMEIECVPARGSRREIAELFAKARVYVDLGCQPGRDRMPREAASMNCKPLVLDAGAGASDFVDWCTDGYGVADRIVREVAKQDEWNWAAGYSGERDTFREEVSDVFHDL